MVRFGGHLGAFVVLSLGIIKGIVIPLHGQYGKNMAKALSEKCGYFEPTDDFVFQVTKQCFYSQF
jgi:hypothetical protein